MFKTINYNTGYYKGEVDERGRRHGEGTYYWSDGSFIRGKWYEGPHFSKMMPIYHPSYLLRNDSREKGSPKWLMWQDIKEIKRVYDSL